MITIAELFLDVDCGNPSRIQNGKVTLATNATYYGATALYECDEHWQLDGVSRRLCQDDGTWSSEAPVCKGKKISKVLISIFLVGTISIIKIKYPSTTLLISV